MIKFYVPSWRSDATITRVEVARETDAFVVLEGERTLWGGQKEKWTRREAKKNTYFDSWKEAHNYLLKQAAHRLDKAHDEYRAASAHFVNVEAMKEETE